MEEEWRLTLSAVAAGSDVARMEATLPDGLAVMSESFSRRGSGTDEYEFVLEDGGEMEECHLWGSRG